MERGRAEDAGGLFRPCKDGNAVRHKFRPAELKLLVSD